MNSSHHTLLGVATLTCKLTHRSLLSIGFTVSLESTPCFSSSTWPRSIYLWLTASCVYHVVFLCCFFTPIITRSLATCFTNPTNRRLSSFLVTSSVDCHPDPFFWATRFCVFSSVSYFSVFFCLLPGSRLSWSAFQCTLNISYGIVLFSRFFALHCTLIANGVNTDWRRRRIPGTWPAANSWPSPTGRDGCWSLPLDTGTPSSRTSSFPPRRRLSLYLVDSMTSGHRPHQAPAASPDHLLPLHHNNN